MEFLTGIHNIGVIVDAISTEVIRFKSNMRLTEMKGEDIQETVRTLAKNDYEWKGVQDGERAAVLFDEETLDSIRINDGIARVLLLNKQK